MIFKGLGRMFYLADPAETSFPTLTSIPHPGYVQQVGNTATSPAHLTQGMCSRRVIQLPDQYTSSRVCAAGG